MLQRINVKFKLQCKCRDRIAAL